MDSRAADIIQNLLHQYECVVLPGLGGFVGEPISATFDPNKHLLRPPSLRLSFNYHLTRNDGLLLQEWCVVRKVSIIQASEEIKQWIDSIHLKLKTHGHANLGSLGSFIMDTNGKISFAFVNNVLSAGYGFGLKSLHLKKHTATNETPVIQLISNNPIGQEITKTHQWKKWVAAAAILLPLSFYSWWIPTQTNVMESGHVSINDLNPFRKADGVLGNYQNRVNTFHIDKDSLADSEKIDGKIRIVYADDVYVEVLVEEPIKPETALPVLSSSGFFLVTGCFREQANADRYLLEMTEKGLNATYIDTQSGLFRVGIGGFSNSADAQAQMLTLKQAGYNSWILRK